MREGDTQARTHKIEIKDEGERGQARGEARGDGKRERQNEAGFGSKNTYNSKA